MVAAVEAMRVKMMSKSLYQRPERELADLAHHEAGGGRAVRHEMEAHLKGTRGDREACGTGGRG